MLGGYSNAMRQSKNNDLLDHGEYMSNAFEDVCLTRESGPGGWRPTKSNRSDALWDTIDYGDTEVSRTPPKLARRSAASTTADLSPAELESLRAREEEALRKGKLLIRSSSSR